MGEDKECSRGLQLNAYGSIHYYLTDEFVDAVVNSRLVKHPAFAKRKEFDLENEYRFAVDVGETLLKLKSMSVSRSETYLGQYGTIFAKLSTTKSFNDIGLIRVIACSESTLSVLLHLCRQREVKFESLTDRNNKWIFIQTEADAINVYSWQGATG